MGTRGQVNLPRKSAKTLRGEMFRKMFRGHTYWQSIKKKWVPTLGATTACTLRLLENFKLNEIGVVNPMKRCVFADSWFASVKTVLALRQHLGMHFTGPIKTAHSQFPLDRSECALPYLN